MTIVENSKLNKLRDISSTISFIRNLNNLKSTLSQAFKNLFEYLKSMASYRSVYRNLEHFENIGPNWSKLGSFVDKHHILHVVDLIFG